MEEDLRKLEEELSEMKVDEGGKALLNGTADAEGAEDNADELVFSKSRMRTFGTLIVVVVQRAHSDAWDAQGVPHYDPATRAAGSLSAAYCIARETSGCYESLDHRPSGG